VFATADGEHVDIRQIFDDCHAFIGALALKFGWVD